MLKYIFVALVLFFSGCTKFEINPSMCDDISPKSDPALIQKCRNYNDAEATKAFNKTKSKKDISDEDIKYQNEEK